MGLSERDLEFRPMTPDDLPLLHQWLQRPHARRWWRDHGTYEGVVAHYLPAIEGSDPTDHYIVVFEGEAIGMVQTYVVADYPDYAALAGITDRVTAGVDIVIAEVELTGKGLGTDVLRRFVDDIVFARPETTSCVADPDARNLASLRAFEKAGFHVERTFADPDDGQTHTLVRRDRYGAQSAPR